MIRHKAVVMDLYGMLLKSFFKDTMESFKILFLVKKPGLIIASCDYVIQAHV